MNRSPSYRLLTRMFSPFFLFQLFRYIVQLEGGQSGAQRELAVIVGIVAEFEIDVIRFVVFAGGCFIDDQVQHVLLVFVVAVVELIFDVQILARNP